MATAFHTDAAGGLWAEQQAGAELDYSLDWSDALDPGDSIALSEWTATAGLTVDRKSAEAATATAWLSGGLAGRSYAVRNTITTGAGRVETRGFRLFVTGDLPAAAAHSVFGPDLGAAVAELRRDRLHVAAQTWMPGVAVSDEYLLGRLLAAERAVERSLRVFLTPREVVPEGTPQTEIDALAAAGEAVVVEPGYDVEPAMFRGDAWGATHLRHRPVIRVHAVSFAYPGGLAYAVPASWVRADRKYGHLNLVPDGTGAVLAASSAEFLPGLPFGAARYAPLALRVRYRAGLADAAGEWPDLVALIRKRAVLDVLGDRFLPGSGSTSADGLSQSFSFDAGKHEDELERALEKSRSALHGIRMAVL